MRPTRFVPFFLLVIGGGAAALARGQDLAGVDTGAEIEASVRVLLDAASDLGALLERTKGFTEFPPPDPGADPWELIGQQMDEVTRFDYPSRRPDAVEARRTLLQHGSAAVPGVLKELRACDLETYGGAARASFGFRLIGELAGGSFATGFGVEPEDVEANREALASWSELWARTATDRGFWTLSYGLDQAKVPRLVEGTASPFIDHELVMPPGTKIQVTNGQETMEISAEEGYWRTYRWDGVSRSVLMEPRSERWYGSLGLYFPGPGNHWEEHEGITRAVVQEGQQHFQTTDEALEWIQEPRKWMQTQYRNDGLVVAWGKDPVTLYVEVWQITIDGKRPTLLPSADDSAIVVTR